MLEALGHTSLLAMHTVHCTAVLSGGTVQRCLVKETDGFIWKTYGHGRQMDTYGRQMNTVWETVS
jgi:hypothetical protein